jgi:S-adenosylmethionine:tRNA-ribosyltransferase-isomerase (queuine synthetase)
MDEKWKDKIERKIEKLEEQMNTTCLVQKDDKMELKELIIDAVKEATNPIMQRLEGHEKRIVSLENQDGKKALLILKSVGGTCLVWFITELLVKLFR